jgi:hypothetical protein
MAARSQRAKTSERAKTPAPPPSPDAFALRARAEIATGGSVTVETHNATEGQEPEAATPAMGTDLGQDPTAEVQATDAQDNAPAPDAGALKEARAEAAKYRKRLRDLEAQQQAVRDQELTESERQAKRFAEMEQALADQQQATRSLALESAVAMRANTLGIVDAEVAVALLDRDALDYDDTGRPDPSSLDMALKQLIKAKPYLKTATAPSSPANPARSEPVGETDAQRRARLYGGGGGMFDPATAASMGGGVVTS